MGIVEKNVEMLKKKSVWFSQNIYTSNYLTMYIVLLDIYFSLFFLDS